MSTGSAIVWFRQDLRLEDNAALTSAAKAGGTTVPLFIHAPDEEGDWPAGRASSWWLHHSLTALSKALDSIGSPLILRRGSSSKSLLDVAERAGADAVYMNRRYEPAAAARDDALQHDLSERGIHVHVFDDSLLFPTDAVRNKSGEPYRVFTPFWKCLLDLEDPGTHRPRPRRLQAPARPHRLPRHR